MLQGSTPVLFEMSEYASLARRLAACLIDLVLLLGIYSVAGTLVGLVVVPHEVNKMTDRVERQKEVNRYLRPVMKPLTIAWLLAIPGYHILLRRFRGGTIGYRLAGIRLVDTYGLPPVMPVLVKRFLVAFPFVLFFGLSYFSILKSPRRQSAHDQWAGTWLVRKKAEPAGPAVVAYQTKILGTMLITYPDLEPVVGAILHLNPERN
jgi:uncharacterized RDD family membrane protein YckC